MVIVKIMKILVLLIEITINDIKDIKITNNVFLNKNVKKRVLLNKNLNKILKFSNLKIN